MMTLEEAITHCKEKACVNTQCALEHRQLAEWLKELQTLKSNNINYKEIEERYPLCINCSEVKQQECAEFCGNYWKSIGATEQKAIDDELCRSGEASDGYHTFNELYDFRREYNAALVNSGVWKAHKSYRHHSGELCFGGGWFIVMIETPFGQISNHYENKYWDEFHCEEKEFADEWDGHTEKDVIARLMKCNNQKQ